MGIYTDFFKQAQNQPDHLAIVFQQEHMTYGELGARVERVASRLLHLLKPSERVGLYLTKSPQALIMMLACLRAGRTYVPIDPKCPVQRRNLILEESQIRLLVLDQYTANDWLANPASSTISLTIIGPPGIKGQAQRHYTWAEMIMQVEKNASLGQGGNGFHGDTLAYILYTSGSTGVPKGVMLTHSNVEAFVEWGKQTFDITPDDHIAVHAALHFDLPVFDIYVGLAKGATLWLVDTNTALFPEALFRFLRDTAVTVLYAVPSALTALIRRSSLRQQNLVHLRYLLYAGEEFHPEPLKILMSQLPAARVFNLYGPIETNVVTFCEIEQHHLTMARIPLGVPIANTSLFLLDAEGQVIIGEGEGEIVISGQSVTPGYLHHPLHTTLTRCTLQQDGHSWMCYRTGDFARRDRVGQLHFLGRKDGLIKTRGFRVELGDIEATISKRKEVVEVAVLAVPHPLYTNLLYAFIVLCKGAVQQMKDNELLSMLCEHLPLFMWPQRIFLRTELPKTSTGKIARHHLQNELKILLQDF